MTDRLKALKIDAPFQLRERVAGGIARAFDFEGAPADHANRGVPERAAPQDLRGRFRVGA